jgi:hypothetical protein
LATKAVEDFHCQPSIALLNPVAQVIQADRPCWHSSIASTTGYLPHSAIGIFDEFLHAGIHHLSKQDLKLVASQSNLVQGFEEAEKFTACLGDFAFSAPSRSKAIVSTTRTQYYPQTMMQNTTENRY